MARWANEDAWTTAIKDAASRHGVPYPLVQAVIGVESAFRPGAYRVEPDKGTDNDSAGLMQILYSTAQGEGYDGTFGDSTTLSGLFDPVTNIEYGTSYLARQYQRAGGDISAAASAYNGGWRPDIGFGAKATKPLSIILARDPQGNVTKRRQVKPGEFSNQPYVDAVLANFAYFDAKRRASEGITQFVTPTTETGAVNPKLLAALVGLLLGLLGIRSWRR